VVVESVIDVGLLRSGHKVPLIKSGKPGAENFWITLSVSGGMGAMNNLAGQTNEGPYKDKGFNYSNYMTFLFIFRAMTGVNREADRLAGRTAQLIEWNVINYSEKVFEGGNRAEREERMSATLKKPGIFRMADRPTSFEITTSADLRMLFLSMPFAQRQRSGSGITVVPNETVTVSVTDFRGY
jgi:hypothetical protein